MIEWREIESAPKVDGEKILGYFANPKNRIDGHEMLTLRWVESRLSYWDSAPLPNCGLGWSIPRPNEECEECCFISSTNTTNELQPTHWMPLPKPPGKGK